MGRSWSSEIRLGVDPGHPRAEDRQQERERPEQDPEGPERERQAAGEPRAARDALRVEDGAGSRGVVVGAEQDAGGGVGALAGRDDVLRGAAEEQRGAAGRRGR